MAAALLLLLAPLRCSEFWVTQLALGIELVLNTANRHFSSVAKL